MTVATVVYQESNDDNEPVVILVQNGEVLARFFSEQIVDFTRRILGERVEPDLPFLEQIAMACAYSIANHGEKIQIKDGIL